MERWYILSWSRQTSHVGLSGIHGRCNSLLAFPFGPPSLDFRMSAIFTCVYACECSLETGRWAVDRVRKQRESLLARAENEVFHLTKVYTI